MISFLFMLLVLGSIGFFVYISYNIIDGLSKVVNSSLEDLHASMAKRSEIINTLINTMRPILKNQKDFDRLARIGTANANLLKTENDIARKSKGEGILNGALSEFTKIIQVNPTLKTNGAISSYIISLDKSKSEIDLKVKKLNLDIDEYNSRLAEYPFRVIAGPLKLYPKKLFKESERELSYLSR